MQYITHCLLLTGGDLFIISGRKMEHFFVFLDRIALAVQTILSISTHFSVAWSVCLSVVCHIRAFCWNRSTDLDAIGQVHVWGPMTHCVRWGSPGVRGSPTGRGDLWLNPKTAKPPVLCSHLTNTDKELGGLAVEISPFAKLLLYLLHYPLLLYINKEMEHCITKISENCFKLT